MSLAAACDREIDIDNIEQPPAVEPADKRFVSVFTPLDGHWQGTFYTLEDTARMPRRDRQLQAIGPSTLEDVTLVLKDSILVQQEYLSETPYFQRVTIRDYYPERGDTIISRGVNKVQDGELWCVVEKPDETVIHEGSLTGEQTFIWQRKEYDPYKEEYFRETVRDSTYEIIGWGYYGQADTTLSPPLWFHGKYRRVEE